MEIIKKIARALEVPERYLIDFGKIMVPKEPKAIPSLQKRLKLIPKLPAEEQKYLAKTIDMIAQRYKIQ